MEANHNISFGADCILSQPNTHYRGRPSKPEELQIEQTLHEFFIRTCSASLASKKTGYNIKTVLKYYNKFQQEIQEHETQDFVNRCRQEKEKCRNALEELIYSLYEDRGEINRLINASEKIGDYNNVTKLYRIKIKINEEIGNFVSARTNLTNTATFSDTADIFKEGEKDGN